MKNPCVCAKAGTCFHCRRSQAAKLRHYVRGKPLRLHVVHDRTIPMGAEFEAWRRTRRAVWDARVAQVLRSA